MTDMTMRDKTKREVMAVELDHAELHSLLELNHQTGLLEWKLRHESLFSDLRLHASWNARFAGSPALATIDTKGYMYGCINYKKYRAHRVIWAMVNGQFPNLEIDHINGVKNDNRPCNLRMVDHKANMKNMKMISTNKSGITGVYQDNLSGNWHSRIQVNGIKIFLGSFKEIGSAVDARVKAELHYGFHANHGSNKSSRAAVCKAMGL